MITTAIICSCYGIPERRAAPWVEPMREACQLAEITTRLRAAAWLAQIGHESGRLRYVREIWGPTQAQRGYEGRRDLGNVQLGDGRRYLGRGPLQVTGRANYARCRDSLRRAGVQGVPDFEADPAALEMPRWGALAAADYWRARGLNTAADAGDMMTLTRRINGGLNGLDDRLAIYRTALDSIQHPKGGL